MSPGSSPQRDIDFMIPPAQPSGISSQLAEPMQFLPVPAPSFVVKRASPQQSPSPQFGEPDPDQFPSFTLVLMMEGEVWYH